MPRQPFRYKMYVSILCGCVAWAALDSFMAWWREPHRPPPLPAAIQFRGKLYVRSHPIVVSAPLPGGISILSSSSYQANTGHSLSLFWLASQSSGSGVLFDLNAFSLILIGPNATSFCRFYDPINGDFIGVATVASDAKSLLSRTRPYGVHAMQWFLGLRPWQVNRCLFVGYQK